MSEGNPFHVFTIGWEPTIIRDLAMPIANRTGFQFTYGLVGDNRQLPAIQKKYPNSNFITLSKSISDPLPEPDYNLLASLESPGVPTIRSMIQGDRILRNRTTTEALGYATLLARSIKENLLKHEPDLILSTFDNLHTSLGLAVAKTLNIPWVAMAFTAIPKNLTWFCKGVTPDALVPIVNPNRENTLDQAKKVLKMVRANRQNVVIYPRSSFSFRSVGQQLLVYFKNFMRRIIHRKVIGFDQFTYTSSRERLFEIFRRWINSISLPTSRMLRKPPEKRFIFFPMHMLPESTIDTWAVFYQDQISLLKQLAIAIPIDVEFVVKLHMSDPDNFSRNQLLGLEKIPGLKIAHPNASGHSFLTKASLVIGITGTACLEAALLRKPVLIFGDSPYQHFPRTEKAKRPDQWFDQIRTMLKLPEPSELDIINALANYLNRYMPGRVNDWRRPIEEKELILLTKCFKELQKIIEVPVYRENWYKEAPFIKSSI